MVLRKVIKFIFSILILGLVIVFIVSLALKEYDIAIFSGIPAISSTVGFLIDGLDKIDTNKRIEDLEEEIDSFKKEIEVSKNKLNIDDIYKWLKHYEYIEEPISLMCFIHQSEVIVHSKIKKIDLFNCKDCYPKLKELGYTFPRYEKENTD